MRANLAAGLLATLLMTGCFEAAEVPVAPVASSSPGATSPGQLTLGQRTVPLSPGQLFIHQLNSEQTVTELVVFSQDKETVLFLALPDTLTLGDPPNWSGALGAELLVKAGSLQGERRSQLLGRPVRDGTLKVTHAQPGLRGELAVQLDDGSLEGGQIDVETRLWKAE